MPLLSLFLVQPKVFLAAIEFPLAEDALAFRLRHAAVGAAHHVLLGHLGLRLWQAFSIAPENHIDQPDADDQQNELA